MPSSNAVITGLGVVSSIGIGCDEYFDALLAKRSGVRSLAERTDDGAKPDGTVPNGVGEPVGLWIGGPIIDFDPKQYVRPRKSLKVMCREIQTAFAASQLAIEHAGLAESLPATDDGKIRPADVGTVFGCEMYYGPPQEMVDPIAECIREDGTIDEGNFGGAARRGVMPLWMLKYLPNMPACHVGISVNAHGPNNSLVLGDVSGPAALIESISCLDRGIAKIVITGASGTRINTTRMNYRNDLPIASVSDSIEHSSRPHDERSQGVVGGEGAGVLVLETAQHARDRGAKVIARVVGYASRFVGSAGMSRSVRTDSIDDPQARGSAVAIGLAIDAAMQVAGISPRDIGLIVSHAMGDPVIDAAERDALSAELRQTPMVCPMASLGHTGAASGTIAIATGALALSKGQIPPTVTAQTAAESVRVFADAAPLKKHHVLCLSHTSEGSATAIILASASVAG
ncbi:MAG: 3-oxoacyl-ACP synthase [Pirellulaceae bacterium]|nr:3-oxoacyl-ACP synthase [Pirellulaceae bacterium]